MKIKLLIFIWLLYTMTQVAWARHVRTEHNTIIIHQIRLWPTGPRMASRTMTPWRDNDSNNLCPIMVLNLKPEKYESQAKYITTFCFGSFLLETSAHLLSLISFISLTLLFIFYFNVYYVSLTIIKFDKIKIKHYIHC